MYVCKRMIKAVAATWQCSYWFMAISKAYTSAAKIFERHH